jgi:hypothetical protein
VWHEVSSADRINAGMMVSLHLVTRCLQACKILKMNPGKALMMMHICTRIHTSRVYDAHMRTYTTHVHASTISLCHYQRVHKSGPQTSRSNVAGVLERWPNFSTLYAMACMEQSGYCGSKHCSLQTLRMPPPGIHVALVPKNEYHEVPYWGSWFLFRTSQ